MPQTSTKFDLAFDPGTLSGVEIAGVRVALGFGGILALVLGVLVLVWPQASLGLIAVLFGLYFLMAGAARVARGFLAAGAPGGIRVLNILLGVLIGIAGIIALRNPLASLAVLGMVVGISWLVEGVAALVETAPDSSKWFGTLFGAISVVAGLTVLLSPVTSLVVLVTIGGIFLLISGAVQLINAFTFGRRARGSAVTD